MEIAASNGHGKPQDLLNPKPKTSGYEPIHDRYFFRQPRDLPLFTFDTIRAMDMEPTILIGEAARIAPMLGIEWAYKQGGQWVNGIEADDPMIAAFVERQLDRVWLRGIEHLLTAQTWGWAAAEVMLHLTPWNTVEIDYLVPRAAGDVRALHRGGELCGAQFLRVKNPTSRQGSVELEFPKCIYTAFFPTPGSLYGQSVRFGAYSPWADKWLNGGALDVRRLFMHKDAYGGCDLSYPDGTVTVEGKGVIPNRDIAREIVEQIQAGGVTTMPSDVDPNTGKNRWELKRATVPSNPTHILQFPDDLDGEILLGLGVPEGILKEGETGAWKGRAIPLSVFFSTLDMWAGALTKSIDHCCIKHLVEMRWGSKADCLYTIRHKPFAEQEAQRQSSLGASSPAGAMPPGQPGPPMPPQADGDNDGQVGEGFKMSLDPAKAVGQGVLNAAELVKAAREVIRMNVTDTSGHEHGGDGKFAPKGKSFKGLKKHHYGIGRKLKSGTRVHFHSGEHAGATATITGVKKRKSLGEPVTYHAQKFGDNQWEGQIHVDAKHLQKHASEIDGKTLLSLVGVTRMRVMHSPSGGVTVQGKFYEGGEFIPGDVVAKATDAEKQKIIHGEAHAEAPAEKGPNHAHWSKQIALAHKLKLTSGHQVHLKYTAGGAKKGYSVRHVGPDKEKTEFPHRFASANEAADFAAAELHTRSKASRAKPASEPAAPKISGNWHYHDRSFFSTGKKAKFRDNVEAVRTLKTVQLEGREATKDEQAKISKYVGWGQFPELFSYDGDWDKERKEFKAIATDEEYASARRSTTNSHYTHPEVIDAHWKMAQRLGFKGGKMLEPAVGSGYYLGMMPKDLAAKTKVTAVEMDELSGGVAKALYPDSHVAISPFQDHATPDNFYDLVATNVPFSGDVRIADPKYKSMKPTLHDYYFMRAADTTKPGGLAMLITSAGTMDKLDKRVRAHLDKNMELVSAVRFPGDTHKENAGTEVVTDMLIMRKKHPGIGEAPEETPQDAQAKEGFTGTTVDSLGRLYHWVNGKRVPKPDWSTTVEVPSPDGKDPIRINKYFADNPDQILGTLDRSGTMYRGDEKNVVRTEDYDERLKAAIERLPENIMQTDRAKAKPEPERIEADREYNEGQFVVKDGQLYQHDNGGLNPVSVGKAEFERVSALIGVRDAGRALIAAQKSGEGIAEARQALNEQYDAFTGKYGAMHKKDNRGALKGDPDAQFLLSLEKYNGRTRKAEKADIFTKDTVRRDVRADKADNITEATGIALHETGGIHLDRISELTGKPQEAVEAELIANGLAYEDPSKGWQPAASYLSGNTRQKLREAKAAAQSDPKYKANVEALERSQPEDIEHDEIGVKLGTPWVPGSVLAEFSAEVLGARPDDFHYKYVDGTADWHAELKNKSVAWRQSNTDVWGVKDDADNVAADYMDIMGHALSGKPLVIRSASSDENGNHPVLPDQTEAAREKIEELKQRFKDWIWEDPERRETLHRYYNDNYNNIVPTHFDGSHLSFPGMREDFKMRGLQKDFVWRVLTTGKGLAAHEVGTGKTASMVAAAMELRRLGLAKKPAIACLKSNIEQITAEAQDLYPGAKILSTADMFSADKRQQTLNRIATGDYNMVILTHDHLDQMKMKGETSKKFIQEEIDELEDAILSARADDGRKSNRIVKQLENAKMKLQEQLTAALNEESKDDIFFEDSGIDSLFVDEAHNFKSLPCHTRRGEIKGIPSQRSQRATNMLMRTRWMLENHNGRGVVFATGTPIANTMGELFNMQRYLQYDDLKERNVHKFDSWADTYGDTTNRIEFKLNGDIAPTTRFNEFVNLPELRHLSSQMMDVQRVDNLPPNPDGTPAIKRPKRHDLVITSPENEGITKMMASIHARASELKGKRRAEKGEDNMLSVCNDAKLGSIDMRLIDKDADDHPDSKLNQAVRKVAELYHANPGRTQAVFSDLGVHPNEWGFSVFADMKQKLMAAGIPESEIVDFSDEKMKGNNREEAQNALTRGDARIAFGSTKRLGTGTNIQRNLLAIHHLDIPYVPAYLEQRDGRGYRSENTNSDVHIFKYVQQGSADNLFWQIVANKSHFINQYMLGKGNRTMQDLDTETLTPDEMIAVSTGDESMLERVNLEDEVRKLRRSQTRHASDSQGIKTKLDTAPDRLKKLRERRDSHAIDMKHLEANPDFKLKIHSGGYHTERPAAGEALAAEVAKAQAAVSKRREQNRYSWHDDDEGPEEIGSYRGMPVYLTNNGFLELEGPSGQRYASGQSLQSLEFAARAIGKKHKESETDISNFETDLTKMQEQLNQPFRHAATLEEKEKRLAELKSQQLNKRKGK